MGIASYARYSVWDYVLCLIASCSLIGSCLIAFQSTSLFLANPLAVFAACAAVLLCLFATAYRFFTAIVGSAALVVVFCVALVLGWQSSGTQSLIDDVPGNYAYIVVVVALCSVACFVLSRKKVGAIVLLVGGLMMCAVMEYLYFTGQVLYAVVFAISVAALIAYKNYQTGLVGSESEKISFGSASLAGVALAALATALACGLFFLVVAPLNPPHLLIKLVTEHVRVEEQHMQGVGDSVSVVNPNLFSMNVTGEEEDANGDNGVIQQSNTMENTQQSTSNIVILNSGSSLDLDEQGEEEAQALTLNLPNWFAPALALLLLLLLVAVFAARKILRARRLNAIKAKDPVGYVKAMYLFIVERFMKIGITPPSCQTLREHSVSSRPMVVKFEGAVDNGQATEYERLTETYSTVVYGGREPSQEELSLFEDYGNRFYGRCVKFVGRLRYIPMFFRI